MKIKKYTVEIIGNRTKWTNSVGQLDREDGPAVEWTDGTKYWYKEGNWHREDGPALEYTDGTKEWYKEGKLHREDGPAVERNNGKKYWYLKGKGYTEAAFLKLTSKTATCNGKIIEIDGKRYSLTLLDK